MTSTAYAAPSDAVVRDLSGQQVTVDQEGLVVLFWSMSDTSAVRDLAELAEIERGGWPVLAINTDGATRRSQVKPYLHRLGLTHLPTAVDVDSQLLAQLQGERGGAVMVSELGQAQARASSPEALLQPDERPERVRAVARSRQDRRDRTDDSSTFDLTDLSRPAVQDAGMGTPTMIGPDELR